MPDLWPGAVRWWDRHLGPVSGRRDGAVHGVWILAPGPGRLMVHQGWLEGRGQRGEWSGCGLPGCPSWEARLSGDGQPWPPWLSPWPLSLALAGGQTLPHTSLPRQLRKPQILCEPERAKEDTGKVLASGELGTVRDVPLRSAPLVYPGSRTRLGWGCPACQLPPAQSKADPRAAMGWQGHLLARSRALWR